MFNSYTALLDIFAYIYWRTTNALLLLGLLLLLFIINVVDKWIDTWADVVLFRFTMNGLVLCVVIIDIFTTSIIHTNGM